MSVLSRYLNRMFLVRFVIVAFGVIGFAAVLDLLDVADDLLKAPQGALSAGLTYFGLRLPIMFSELMPMSALIAGLLAVGDHLRHRELVVIWSSGIAPAGLLRLLLPAFLLLVGGKFLVDELALPRAATELRLWGIGDYRHQATEGQSSSYYWLRSGDDIMRLPVNAVAAGQLLDITIFRRNPAGILTERIEAASAEVTGTGWRLHDVTRARIGTRQIEELPTLDWAGSIDLERVRLLARPPGELPIHQLRKIIAAGGYGMRATEPYVTWLHQRISGSFVPGLLMLLGYAIVRRFSRTATLAPVFLAAVTIGFALIILNGIGSALGEVGLVPPVMAAWTPTVVLALAIMALTLGRGRLRRPMRG